MCSIWRRGGAWRVLPHALPPGKTGSPYVRRWRLPGRWAKLHAALQAAVRLNVSRHSPPRAALRESPAVQTRLGGGPRGSEGGKNGKGRKRYRLVETPGWVLRAGGHPVTMTGRDGLLELGSIRQRGGKVLAAWAAEGDLDPEAIASGGFTMEWPPRSGNRREFPEVDRAGWFDPETARRKLLDAQAELVGPVVAGLQAGRPADGCLRVDVGRLVDAEHRKQQ